MIASGGSAGLNAVHGLAYAVAAQTHKSHGSTNAVMLPYVLDEIAAVRPQEFAELADVLGLGPMDAAAASRAVPVRVRTAQSLRTIRMGVIPASSTRLIFARHLASSAVAPRPGKM